MDIRAYVNDPHRNLQVGVDVSKKQFIKLN